MNRVSHFLAELLRRKVVRFLGAYIATFFLLIGGLDYLFEAWGVPDGYLDLLIIIGTAALPVLAILSWKYNLVPPALVPEGDGIEDKHPLVKWAIGRHDSRNAGHLKLSWTADGEAREEQFLRAVTIGRDADNAVEIPDKYVSRFHAVLWAEDGRWLVRDLESTNGTYIDGKRVNDIASLPADCDLRFHPKGPSVAVEIFEVPATAISTEI